MCEGENIPPKLRSIRRPRLQRKLRALLAEVGTTEAIVIGDDGTRLVVSIWLPKE